MQAQSPLSCYQQALNTGKYQADELQHQAAAQLEHIYEVLQQAPAANMPTAWLGSKLSCWLGKSSKAVKQRQTKGLYMWGGVGRGKTWLMNMFFHTLPGDRKLRLHFHRFMLHVHEQLTELQGQENPLESVADRFKLQTDVLCFDEFFISDITDAMLLGTLLQALFARGIMLVATSNIKPDSLYLNGLQRARFLPAINLINEYCEVINLDAGIDYRVRTLTQARLYLMPLNAQTRESLDRMFITLAGQAGEEAPLLQVNHRPLQAIRAVDGVLAVDFHTLCEEACSQLDYIALSHWYHSVILHNVRVMGPGKENAARRFLALVDEFYERHVKLVIAAEASMFEIYQGKQLKFEYQRCLSRLQEMQSEEYLKLPHL